MYLNEDLTGVGHPDWSLDTPSPGAMAARSAPQAWTVAPPMHTTHDPYRSANDPAGSRNAMRKSAKTEIRNDAAPIPTPKCVAYEGNTGVIRFTPTTLRATMRGIGEPISRRVDTSDIM